MTIMGGDQSHTSLIELAVANGIPLRDGETDEQLRIRVHRLLTAVHRGSIDALDRGVTETIDDMKPIFVETSLVKRNLAIVWLRQERPASLWVRIAWAWRTMRALWQ